MNLDKIVWRTRHRVGTALEDDGKETPGEVSDLVNDAYLELADAESWPWVIDTWTVQTNGQQTVTLPTDVDKVLHVAIPAKDRALTRRPQARLADGPDGGNGIPAEYALSGSDLTMRPKPTNDIELEVRGITIPSELSGQDEPAFHRTYHPILIYLAAAEFLESRADYNNRGQIDPRIEQYRQRANTMLAEMRDHYLTSHDQQPVVIGGRSHYGPNHVRPGSAGRLREWFK